MLVDDDKPTYTCKCLNIRIRPLPSAHTPPAVIVPEFIPVHVGDEGITIVHPEVTLRTRSRCVPIDGTSKCNRHTSLTCLICQTLAYRVHQVVPMNIQGKEGPQHPTEDWVEREIMKSLNGWIEVHQSCLTGDSIVQAANSLSYSDTFRVVLHTDQLPQSPSTAPSILPILPSLPDPPSPPNSLKSFLPPMKPLFPPAPFTSSHPTFVHFSTLAADESRKLRTIAEEDISKAVVDKVALIHLAEDKLRQQVEILWKHFREGVSKAEQDRVQSARRLTITRHGDSDNLAAANSEGNPPTVVSIRDFTPTATPPTRSATTTPRLSSLSASLATSSFHHPKGTQTCDETPHPPPRSPSPSSPHSTTNPPLSSQSDGSSGPISLRSDAAGSNILGSFKRSMDPTKDSVASFNYFTNAEADMARKQEAPEKVQDPTSPEITRGRSAVAQDPNGNRTHGTSDSQASHQHPVLASEGPVDETSDHLGREDGSRGKRKVTFDVKPDVVTIDSEENRGNRTSAASETEGDLIFDLEDEGSEHSSLDSTSQPALPLTEPAHGQPRLIRKSKAFNHIGLPESFVALRPMSLPLPSHIQSPKSHVEFDTSRRAPLQPTRDSRRKPRPQRPLEDDPTPLDDREAEILKLVAASTPSHRGAWKRDSKAWQLFVRKKDGKHSYSGIIPEEIEDGDVVDLHKGISPDRGQHDSDLNGLNGASSKTSPLVGSLPIAINSVSRPKEALSLASYQPMTSFSQPPSSDPFSSPAYRRSYPSSTALRKAAYAERDRTRSIDPGALDFAAEDDDDESDDDVSMSGVADAGERGRRRALRILQALSELPEPGMWRSLA